MAKTFCCSPMQDLKPMDASLQELLHSLHRERTHFRIMIEHHLQVHWDRQAELVKSFAEQTNFVNYEELHVDLDEKSTDKDLAEGCCDAGAYAGTLAARATRLPQRSEISDPARPALNGHANGNAGPRTTAQMLPLSDKEPQLDDAGPQSVASIVAPLSAALQRVEELLAQQGNGCWSGHSGLLMPVSPISGLGEPKDSPSAVIWRSFSNASLSTGPSPSKRLPLRKTSSSLATSEASLSTWRLRSEHGSAWGQKIYNRFAKHIEWWANLEEPPRENFLARIVLSTQFGSLCAFVIFMNTIFLIFATNREIETLGAPMPVSMRVFELGFVCFFGFELLVKLLVHRHFYFCNQDMKWNIMDFVLIVAAWFEVAVESTSTATMLRPLRVLKMAKILRVARLMHFFPILSMMLNSLVGSLGILFWSLVMLTFMFYLFSVALVQGVTQYLIEMVDTMDAGTERRIMKDFGSVQNGMLTLYKVAFGGMDWAEALDLIAPSGALNSVIFIIFVSLMHIAMLNILTGIFVECALKLATPDREFLACEKRMQNQADVDEFRHLFHEIQRLVRCPGDTITRTGFLEAIQFGRIKAHMEVLGVNLKDPISSFKALAHGDTKEIDIDTFVEGCMELKGSATSMDLQVAIGSIQEVQRGQKRLWDGLAFCMELLRAREGCSAPPGAAPVADGCASDKTDETPRRAI